MDRGELVPDDVIVAMVEHELANPGRVLFDGTDVSASGVVHQHVDPAMAADDVLDGGVDRGGVGHVKRQHIDLAGVRRREAVE